MPTKMFAFVTRQGTAMAETALCDADLTPTNIAMAQAEVDRPLANEWDRSKAMTDCTDNDTLECIVCGEVV